MRRHSLFVFVALLLSTGLPGRAMATDKAPMLTAEDKKLLEDLMKDFLFDPKGAERVVVKTIGHGLFGNDYERNREGWLLTGRNGEPGFIYFTDGDSIVAPTENDIKKVDFVVACKARYAPPAKKDDQGTQDAARGARDEEHLTLAAWLYRFAEEGLAAKALSEAQEGKNDPRQSLRDGLALSAFYAMVDAYRDRADAEALTHGKRLLRLYPEESKGLESTSPEQIIESLKQRQKKNTFGKKPPDQWPNGFVVWDIKRKSAYLLDSLDEVDVHQMSYPGSVVLGTDRRVKELIRLGDSIVPDLIAALEMDDRLTRAVPIAHWRDRSRTVLTVRDAVEAALFGILKIRDFDTTADDDAGRDDEWSTPKNRAARARTYWKTYGPLTFDDRMMKILTEPKTSSRAKREAIANLVRPENPYFPDPSYQTFKPAQFEKLNPVVAKYSDPTLAEAIVANLDTEVRSLSADGPNSSGGGIEQAHLIMLVELGDTRIAKVVAARAALASQPHLRRIWSEAAHYLGEKAAFRSFIQDFRLGKLGRFDDGQGIRELLETLSTVIRVQSPEANDALVALAEPNHPLAKTVTQHLLNNEPFSFSFFGFDRDQLFGHAYCLSILRRVLDDTSPTGATITIKEDYVRSVGPKSSRMRSLPHYLAGVHDLRKGAEERTCDFAAEKLLDLMVGLPIYHPLFKDADKRLDRLKAEFDRFAGNYRAASGSEMELLKLYRSHTVFLPDIRPLNRPATAADVKAGKAIFHINGNGKPARLELPAVAELKAEKNKDEPTRLLILQAEVGPDGETTYGIVTAGAIRTATVRELTNIKSLAHFEKEQEAADRARKEKD